VTAPSTERVRQVYERDADRYDRQMAIWEKVLFAGVRQWAVGRTAGRILEIGVGTGRNLPLYPPDADLIGVDVSERMLEHAQSRAAQLGMTRAEFRAGDVQDLELPDCSVDTVISTFTMCAIPNPQAAAREAHRVLRPDGRFVVVEHGPSTNRVVRAGQRLFQPLTLRLEADHLLRDPRTYLTQAGFALDEEHRAKAGIVFRLVARKP